MANKTVWNPIRTIPREKLVIVFDNYQGYALRAVTSEDEWYDENENYDDSGMEWGWWAELPEKPFGNKRPDKPGDYCLCESPEIAWNHDHSKWVCFSCSAADYNGLIK